MFERETKTFKVKRAGIEATRTGYTVTLERRDAPKGDLVTVPYGPTTKTADEAYRSASLTAASINKHGHWTGRRGEWLISIRGKKATCTREMF